MLSTNVFASDVFIENKDELISTTIQLNEKTNSRQPRFYTDGNYILNYDNWVEIAHEPNNWITAVVTITNGSSYDVEYEIVDSNGTSHY